MSQHARFRKGKVNLEVLVSPLKQTVLSNSKAFSNGRFLLVIQASIPPLDMALLETFFFLKIITNRVVVKLADELMSREAFTHQNVNLLLGGK